MRCWHCCPEICGCPIPGGAQGWVGWGPGQPELVGSAIPWQGDGTGWTHILSSPNHSVILWLHDYVILWHTSSSSRLAVFKDGSTWLFMNSWSKVIIFLSYGFLHNVFLFWDIFQCEYVVMKYWWWIIICNSYHILLEDLVDAQTSHYSIQKGIFVIDNMRSHQCESQMCCLSACMPKHSLNNEAVTSKTNSFVCVIIAK